MRNSSNGQIPREVYFILPKTTSEISSRTSAMQSLSVLNSERQGGLSGVYIDSEEKDKHPLTSRYCNERGIPLEEVSGRSDFLTKVTSKPGENGVFAYVTKNNRRELNEIAAELSRIGFHVEVRQRF